jgi:hypothetical protein
MKNLFLALIFLVVSLSSLAGVTVPGFQPYITMGGVTMPLSKAIVLKGYATDNTQYQTLWRNGAAYQVPTGKKLICVALNGTTSGTADPIGIVLGYGDNAVSSTTAPTNNTVLATGGAATALNTGWGHFRNWRDAGDNSAPMYIEFPASKYPYFRTGSAGGYVISILCYLQDV